MIVRTTNQFPSYKGKLVGWNGDLCHSTAYTMGVIGNDK